MTWIPRTIRMALAVSFVLLVANPSHAATFIVDSTADEVDANPGDGLCSSATGACTLRASIQEANASVDTDTVYVPAGYYLLTIMGDDDDTAATGDLDILGPLVLLGEAQPTTTIHGNGADNVFDVRAPATMINLTVTGASRAGIADGTALTMSSCSISYNAGNGIGGITCVWNNPDRCFGPLTITDSIIEGNGSDGAGDEIALTQMTVTNSVVRQNGAAGLSWGQYIGNSMTVDQSAITNNAMGILLRGKLGGLLTVKRSGISFNTAGGIVAGPPGLGGGQGLEIEDSVIEGNTGLGGIAAQSYSHGVSIVRSFITGNSSSQPGGGVYAYNLGITDSTVANNTTASDGGGIATNEWLFALNTSVSGNHANGSGGGIYLNYPPYYGAIYNVTIADNTADYNGDGIGSGGGYSAMMPYDCPECEPNVFNTLIAGNHDLSGTAPDCAEIYSGGYNLIGDATGCVVDGDSSGNLINIDPQLEPLADNGGSTRTHALLANSAAINAGNPAGCRSGYGLGVNQTDQRGVPRPQFGRCDIGAFEFACGNSLVDPGESCDDGNSTDGDCCSANCQFEPSGSPCTDGNACTTEACDGAGSCSPGSAVDCGACETCDTAAGCIASVLTGCHQPTERFSGQLQISNTTKPKLRWQWTRGEATDFADFGDPPAGDRYSVCLFDESGPTPQLAFRATTSAGLCDGRPCWRTSGVSSFKYKDRTQTPAGLDALLLKAGPDGKAKIGASGGGAHLDLPALPLPLPLRVQLQAANGKCWEARYQELGTSRNDAKLFKSKAFQP
jgi:CSLREA domain-containing protein